MRNRVLSISIYALSTVIGVLAFIYPFLVPSIQSAVGGQAHTNDAPLVLTALVGLCFIVLLLEVQGQAVNAKFVALLGLLVSMNAVLRFLEIAIPGPGGISPIFFLIVLSGYVYGPRFGFLMGALTLLVSALMTGAAGPWLPYQMFTASWIGMSAPLCRPLVRLVQGDGRRFEVVVLALFAGFWGFIFGAIMNVWFWPFAVGPTDQYWEAGIGLLETLKRYAAFYVTTSFAWDAVRAVGNVLMTLAFAAPALRVLRRFQRRFAFSHRSRSQLELESMLPQAVPGYSSHRGFLPRGGGPAIEHGDRQQPRERKVALR
jgi:energy-coupling factor transport system substrate-specific component